MSSLKENYTYQFQFNGGGPLDYNLRPLNSVDELSTLRRYRWPGMTVSVMENGAPVEYWFVGTGRTDANGVWKKKAQDEATYSMELEGSSLSLTKNGEKITDSTVELSGFVQTIVEKLDDNDAYIYSGEITDVNDESEIGIFLKLSFTGNTGNIPEPVYVPFTELFSSYVNTTDFNTFSGTVENALSEKLDKSFSATVETKLSEKLEASFSATVESALSEKLDNSFSAIVESALSEKLDNSFSATVETALSEKLDNSFSGDVIEYVSATTNELRELLSSLSGSLVIKGKKDSIEELEAITDAKNGEIYRVGENEFVYSEGEWVELGPVFNIESYISDFVTSGYVESAISSAISSAITEVESKGYITEDAIEGFVKGDEVDTRISAATDNFVKKAEVDSKISAATADFITEDEIDTKISTATSGMVTEEKLQEELANFTPASENVIEHIQVNGTEIEPVDKTVNIDLSKYTTSGDVAEMIAKATISGSDMSVYYTASEVDAKISAATEGFVTENDIEGFVTEEEVDGKINTATSGMATESWVDTRISAATADFLTEAALDGFVKEEDVDGKIETATSGMATESWVDTRISAATADFLTEAALDGFVKEDEVDGKIETATSGMATESWVKEQGYATSASVTSIKEELEGKFAGLWHLKGKKDSYEEVENITDPEEGDVYLVGEEEYAYVDGGWTKLGYTTNTDGLASDEDVANAISAATAYTDEKIQGLDLGEKNVITGITVNGSAITVTDKVAVITIEQATDEERVNDIISSALTEYSTSADTESAKQEVIGYVSENVIAPMSDMFSAYTIDLENVIERVESLEASGVTVEGGSAITVSDGIVSVNIASASTEAVVDDTKKNFLHLNEEQNGLEVNGVDADAAVLQDAIEVTESFGAVTSGTTFAKGTSVYDILLQMLSKEKWATSLATGKTFTATVGKPSITAQTGTVEIGTLVPFSATCGSSSASQTVTAKTFTYGYATDNTGANYTSATEYKQTLSPTVKSGSTTYMNATFTGFSQSQSISGVSSVSGMLTVVSGTNKVNVAETGLTYNADLDVATTTLYAATNLKHYYKEDKTTDNTVTITNPWGATSTTYGRNSDYKQCTGDYIWFVGYSNDLHADTTWDSEKVRALSLFSGFTTVTKSTTAIYPMGAKQEVIAVPEGMTFKALNSSQQDETGTYGTPTKVDVVLAGNENVVKTYDVYIIDVNAGLGADDAHTITLN